MNWSKKNIQTLLLIASAIVVWIMVAGKFFGYTSNEIPKEQSFTINFQQNEVDSQEYKLNLAYKDPFLKGIKQGRKSSNTQVVRPIQTKSISNKKKKEEVKQEPTFTWPDISYKGKGSNKSREETFAWIEFNGEMKILELNKVVKNFRVEAIYQDSLIISREGKSKTYLKK